MKERLARLNEILTTVRQWTVNLFTLFILVYMLVLVISIVSQMPEQVDPDGRVLIIAPEGVVVDQAVYASTIDFPPDFSEDAQIQYRDLLRVIEAAGEDERLQAVLIDFSGTQFGGPATALGIADALAELRKGDKPVIAFSDTLGNGSYLMASQADEVYLHPSGVISLAGLGGYRPYVRDLLDSMKLTLHNYSQGEYKSAAETFYRNDMSAADRRQTRELLDPLWQAFLQRMAAGRGVDASVFQQLADDYPAPDLGEAAFVNIRFALEQGVIDGTKNFPEFRAWMMERFGVDEGAERETYPAITAGQYLAQLEDEPTDTNATVAVVFAQGLLVRGEQKPGIAGADDIAALLRRAYEDENTRAIVVRVNSPGGGVLASDMIHEEMLAARSRGLPVVVSMGDVAASGGMWVSSAADRIYAMPSSIVGSIGVAVIFPTAENLFDFAGIHFDGVATAEHGGWGLNLPMNEKLDAVFHRYAEGMYQRFVEVVAEGRRRDPDYIRSIGGGRTWIGSKAKEVGLVDEFGGLEDAIAAAASMASLDAYRVDYVSREMSFGARLLRDLSQQAPLRVHPVYEGVMGRFAALLEPIAGLRRPRVEALCADCLVKLE